MGPKKITAAAAALATSLAVAVGVAHGSSTSAVDSVSVAIVNQDGTTLRTYDSSGAVVAEKHTNDRLLSADTAQTAAGWSVSPRSGLNLTVLNADAATIIAPRTAAQTLTGSKVWDVQGTIATDLASGEGATPIQAQGSESDWDATAMAAGRDGVWTATRTVFSDATTTASLWLRTPTAATKLVDVPGVRLVALADSGDGTALGLAVPDSNPGTARIVSLSSLGATSLSSDLVMPGDLISAEVGWASRADGPKPVLLLTRESSVDVDLEDGNTLVELPAGSRVHLISGGTSMVSESQVSNPLQGTAVLNGLGSTSVIRAYGSKVRLAGTIALSGLGYQANWTSPTLAVISKAGSGTTNVSSAAGSLTTLRRNTCFSVTDTPSPFWTITYPSPACVKVSNDLRASFTTRTRAAVIMSATSATVSLQRQVSGKWIAFKILTLRSGKASLVLPVGAVRAVAPTSKTNSASTVMVSSK